MEDVKYEDREPEIHQIQIALNMCGIFMDYKITDMAKRVFDCYKKKGGKMDISDATKLKAEWEKHWKEYNEKQNKKDDYVELT